HAGWHHDAILVVDRVCFSAEECRHRGRAPRGSHPSTQSSPTTTTDPHGSPPRRNVGVPLAGVKRKKRRAHEFRGGTYVQSRVHRGPRASSHELWITVRPQ